MPTNSRAADYIGVTCPHCARPLEAAFLSDGEDICPNCQRFFELRLFHPPPRPVPVPELAAVSLQNAATCANHPRLVASTTCDRCGIFMCPLCDLDVADAHYCPACFERLVAEGSIESGRIRLRDYTGLALMSATVGFFLSFFLGIPLGLATYYYAWRAFRTAEGRRATGTLIVSMLLALVDLLIGTLLIYQLSQVRKIR